jgi:MerR family copper efflux transcriptional regulator
VRSKLWEGDGSARALRIGELAKQSGLTSTALRYYEKTGLLRPTYRTRAGYRAYEASVLPRLAFIRAAQAVGLTLAEIRDVIRIREGGTPPCRHVVDLIDRRRGEVRARILDLQRLERELAELAETGARIDPAECDASSICSVIPTSVVLAGQTVRAIRSDQRAGANTAC